MKYLTGFIIFSYLVLTMGCQSQKKDRNTSSNNVEKNIISIELTEQTRGTNRKITFKNSIITINVNGITKSSPILTPDWNNIVKETQLIDLEKLSTYTSPTTGRYSDAALSSTITITDEGKQYNSLDFDAGIPPKQLEALYKKLLQARDTLPDNSSKPKRLN